MAESGCYRIREYVYNMVAISPYFCGMEWIFSVETLNETAAAFLQATGRTGVFAFHGQMGAGKTTFIHALCEVLGVKDVVGSPTFSIINEYRYLEDDRMKPLFHMDLYRLRDEEEAQRAGVEDALYSGHTCLVEWPEKAAGIFPDNTVHVSIELVDTKTRRLKITNI
jgi:tRNA threonylcarbamoyladenosine biosynthesis protein TsaE